MSKKLTMLMILDGLGFSEVAEGNAVKQAELKNIEKIKAENPNTLMHTSGLEVGLPEGQMGNSEVGHINIGAGRVVYQESTGITKSIEDGDFFSNEVLCEAIAKAKENGTHVHVMGLVSDGGVHSSMRHLYAILELAKRQDFNKVFVHCFLDGRDTSTTSGINFVQELQEKIEEKGVGKIASICGRFYAMDRDNRWERVEKAYNMLVNGVGTKEANAINAIEKSYQKEVFDEFIEPTVIVNNSEDEAITIKNGDSVIFFNFRHDRAREITRALVDKDFNQFETKKLDLNYVCMTEYDANIKNVQIAFKPQSIDNTFGEYISKLGMKQLRIAETEKYAHVTFFFNGGTREEPFVGENRILIPSPKVETYDLKPEMSAYEVTDNVIQAIKSNEYDSIILNYANPDMVGHTGNMEATIKALEAIDECVGKVYEAIKEVDANLLIIADHGNAEQMVDYKTGEVCTSHTTNDVPCVLVTSGDVKLKDGGKLADVAPTLLSLMGIPKPTEMTGESLID
jgi:2,3-bisphosphoglycerate-independent phosphoglycerate mutase